MPSPFPNNDDVWNPNYRNHNEQNNDKIFTVVFLIAVHVALGFIAVYIVQPNAEKVIVEHEHAVISKIESMSCEDLWKYHAEEYCGIRTGCYRNDHYQYAMERYQHMCR